MKKGEQMISTMLGHWTRQGSGAKKMLENGKIVQESRENLHGIELAFTAVHVR